MTQLAFIFPGQGSQHVGMLKDLISNYSIVRETFQEASYVLKYDLLKLVSNGPNEDLNKTCKTQPAILASSVALYRIWKQKGGEIPIFMAGHSLGEYSALVCAGVLNFTDTIKLVELRGKLMQESVKERIVAMQAIIGLSPLTIQQICKETKKNQVVSIANFNAPDQFIISGDKEAVDRASIICKLAGAKYTIPLVVSIPAHCMLMKSAAEKLEITLKKIIFKKPSISIINNVDVKIEYSIEAIRIALIRQMYNPVRWIDIIKLMAEKGITRLLEIGPGSILSNLTKRISKHLTSIAINDNNSLLIALDKDR
ncbi:[acyl-carrier-protein] S-malonyltransferase [Candidatus Pantoea edessiphila]|uniref:Malonyl CoA-acyl carrier protein transacylase n=1 Tax=Candidatus Pantoea edessiphila TaxID=2044610 RepID=A0A2P5T2J3_9GAMM|nr:ACP S-malonyltransferase [Candidatus Pantoea edessiphila]PPI88772.1 [acyl-carrier-protein] S-malonyltransferase [Candidatus Pantoea edessiphila]